MKKQSLILPPQEHVDAHIRATTEPTEAALLWLLRNGLRCSEAIGLRLDDLFEDAGCCVAIVHGKGDKYREVPLYHTTSLAVWLSVENDKWPKEGSRRILTTRNQPAMSRKTAYNICMKRTGQHPHTLRHLYATELVNKGVGLHLVQALLGHENLNTTMRYYHVTRNNLIEATNGASGH